MENVDMVIFYQWKQQTMMYYLWGHTVTEDVPSEILRCIHCDQELFEERVAGVCIIPTK